MPGFSWEKNGELEVPSLDWSWGVTLCYRGCRLHWLLLVSSAVSPLSEEAIRSQQPCGLGRHCAIPVQNSAAVKTRLPVPPSTHCTHPVSPGSDFEESGKIYLLTLEAGTSLFSFIWWFVMFYYIWELCVWCWTHVCVDVCTPVCMQGLEQGVRCSDLSPLHIIP